MLFRSGEQRERGAGEQVDPRAQREGGAAEAVVAGAVFLDQHLADAALAEDADRKSVV